MIQKLIGRFVNKNNLNTLIYLFSSVFGAGVGFLMLRKFTVYLGPSDIGIFGYVTAVNTFLIPLFTLNLENYYIKEVYNPDTTVERKKTLLGTIVLFILIWTILLTAILTVVGSMAFTALHIKFEFFPYMFYTLLSNLLLGVTIILMLQYRILSKPWMYFIVNALQTILIIGIGYFFVAYMHLGIKGRIYGMFVGWTIMGVLSFILIAPHMKWAIDKTILKKAIIFCLPLIPYTLANQLFDFLDRFYLEKYYKDLSHTGLYNMGAQYAVIISMLSMAFYRAYETEIFRMTAEGNEQGISKSMIMLNNVILLIAAPLIICSGPLINYLTHGKFPGSALIASLLIVAFFFRSAYIMLNTILTAQSRTKEILWFSIGGLIFVILASMYFVRQYDNIGTASIKIALYMLMFGSSFFVIRKAPSYRKYIFHTIFAGSILIGIVLVLNKLHFI